MYYLSDLKPYCVFCEEKISQALIKINENKLGFIFVVDDAGRIEGVVTDGDFRRAMVESTNISLDNPILQITNKNFVFANQNNTPEEIKTLFSERVSYIPVVDDRNRIVKIVVNKSVEFRIGSFIISNDSKAFIIAEIGNNHNGSIDLAKKLIDEAISAGADCVKFQMRDLDSMYSKGGSGDSEDLGAEYTLDLLRRFQLTTSEMFSAFDYCKSRGVLPLCTPWDKKSLEILESYGLEGYKVASADLSNHDLLINLCKTRKPLIVSTGMSLESEIKQAVKIFQDNDAQFILLHCNSTYPAPFKDINLGYMSRLKSIGNGSVVGYSGHERGYSIPIAAVALGAKVIEKHFTLDRTMEGNDHKVSLLPSEFLNMVASIREVELALGKTEDRVLSQGELMNREVLGKSLVAKNDIEIGDSFSENNIDILSPGKGLSPNRKSELIGNISKRKIKAGDFIFPSDIGSENSISPSNYTFNRPFGIPVRFHDFEKMLSYSKFDLIEFHFSYKDLELDASQYLKTKIYNQHLVVHSPELFRGDHILDLCSDDELYRKKSIEELQRVIDFTRDLKFYFPKTEVPLIIVNVGGATTNTFMSGSKKEKYNLVIDAFKQLDSEGVELIPQTMPPFPWHFGGQRYHNLFVSDDEIVDFCRNTGMRICLDVSHSKLACKYLNISFDEFLTNVAPFAAHLHIVDAKGVDGEGLQIGEGEIDFISLGNQLKKFCPTASFIPEIWQGHKNDGEGFWLALSLLEKYFK
jgi:sialic acid synthase SpsE/sugar phosphate isomerase/epimerase